MSGSTSGCSNASSSTSARTGARAGSTRGVLTYYEEAGLVYWTMGAPLAETTIVNRCRSEETYENRLAAGTLP